MKRGREAPRQAWSCLETRGGGSTCHWAVNPGGPVWRVGQISPNIISPFLLASAAQLFLPQHSVCGVRRSQAQLCCSREAAGCLRDTRLFSALLSL